MSTKRILKYPLNDGQVSTNIKCRFVRALDIQLQDACPTVWILTDSDAQEVTIRVVPVGTGWEIPTETFQELGEYVKTIQDDYGYVWHYHLMRLS